MLLDIRTCWAKLTDSSIFDTFEKNFLVAIVQAFVPDGQGVSGGYGSVVEVAWHVYGPGLDSWCACV